MVAPAANNQDQYPEVVIITPALECCQLGDQCLICAAWTLFFTTILSYLTTHWPYLCHLYIYIYIVYISIKNIIATKMGQNKAILGQIPHFGPLSLEKNSKRVENQVPPNWVFSIPNDSSSCKKYSCRVSRWIEALVRVLWPKMWILSAKIWTEILPRPLGRSILPLWTIYLNYLNMVCIKKSHPRTFAQMTPSGNMAIPRKLTSLICCLEVSPLKNSLGKRT